LEGACGTYGFRIGTYKVLMGRSEQNRVLERASLFSVFRQKKKKVNLKSILIYVVF
jgi:hypothetical protein